MNKHEEKMVGFGCPECGKEIELYDTTISGKQGRYRCLSCGRDTTWAVGEAMSIIDLIKKIKKEQLK